MCVTYVNVKQGVAEKTMCALSTVVGKIKV